MDVLSWCLEIGENNRFQLNPGKTELVLGHAGSWAMPPLVLAGFALPQTDLMHNLGVLLDLELLLKEEVVVVAQRAFAQHRSMGPIPGLVCSAHTHSCPGHLPGSLYQGLPLNSIYKLQVVQNAAPWSVMYAPGAACATPLHEQHQLPIRCIVNFMVWGHVI